MNRTRPIRTSHLALGAVAALALLGAAALVARGQAEETSRPLLEQLSRETQSLYREVQKGVVRVQLPPARFLQEAVAQDDPIRKYGAKLDPQVRSRLMEQRARAESGKQVYLHSRISPATQSAAAPATGSGAGEPAGGNGGGNGGGADVLGSPWRISGGTSGEVILEPRNTGTAIVIRSGGDRVNGQIKPPGPLEMALAPANGFAPNDIGLLLDDQGHFLVPQYVEKERIGPQGVRVMVDGQETIARFVGSDRPTMITVLKLERKFGRPVPISAHRPPEGALSMLLSPTSGKGSLVIWTGAIQDYGIIASLDGAVAGFAKHGQFLSTASLRPVIEQLVRTGTVRRATLGVRLSEISPEDPLRLRNLVLGTRPALRVTDVSARSPAERAGLRPGDLILSLAGESVGDTPTFAAALAGQSRGAELRILRNDELLTITVELKSPATRPAE